LITFINLSQVLGYKVFFMETGLQAIDLSSSSS